jgi:hypothetical protein
MQQIHRNIKANQKFMDADQYDKNLKAVSRNTYWHESKSKFDKGNELKYMNKMYPTLIKSIATKTRSRMPTAN